MNRCFSLACLLGLCCCPSSQIEQGPVGIDKGVQLDRFILPGSIRGERPRSVALQLDSIPSPAGILSASYLLERRKGDPGVWDLLLTRIPSWRDTGDWTKTKSLTIRNNDIVPLGKQFYHFAFDSADDFITVERITAKLEDRFKLSDMAACFSTNMYGQELMVVKEGDIVWSDVFRLDEFSATEPVVDVSIRPDGLARKVLPGPSKWTSQTLKVGAEWKVRSHVYQVLSVVPPQEIPEGNLVGWIELRLKERNPENAEVN